MLHQKLVLVQFHPNLKQSSTKTAILKPLDLLNFVLHLQKMKNLDQAIMKSLHSRVLHLGKKNHFQKKVMGMVLLAHVKGQHFLLNISTADLDLEHILMKQV